MLLRLRSKHPVLYCAIAEALFLAALRLGQLAVVLGLAVLINAGALGVEVIDNAYLFEIIIELIGAAVPVALLWRTGEAKLMRRRGSGFFNGMLVGMWPFVLIAYNMMVQIIYSPSDVQPNPPLQIVFYIVYMFAVGMAEEFLGRGVIAETLLEHFGTTRAGVWKACLVSGLIFGAGHLVNMLSSAPFGVLMQCVFAATLGVIFAAIYFRTGNLWVTVFLHMFMDISALWYDGVYSIQSAADTVSSYDLSMLYSLLIYGIPTIILLRKSKIGEVELYFGDDCQKPAAPAEPAQPQQ